MFEMHLLMKLESQLHCNIFFLILFSQCGNGSDFEKLALPKFVESESSGNVTTFKGETAYLQCTVTNIGNKSVSWLRHLRPIPQLLALNNLTNSPDSRLTAFHRPGEEMFALRIRNARFNDSGFYECQVAGNDFKSKLYRIIFLRIVEPVTYIVGGSDIYVDRGSTLNVTCAVSSGRKKPSFIYWSRNDQIISFDGAETSEKPILSTDRLGRSISRLIIRNIDHHHAGIYMCQPAYAKPKSVTVHVLNGTVLAVANVEESKDLNNLLSSSKKKNPNISTSKHKAKSTTHSNSPLSASSAAKKAAIRLVAQTGVVLIIFCSFQMT